jgi:SIR2-like protein
MGFEHLSYTPRAAEFLAQSLGDGTLVLFLGAGASSGVGLPDWQSLIESLQKEVGLSNAGITSNPDALQRAADEVRRKFKGNDKEFAGLVKKVLYSGVNLSDEILRNPLLIALGALMTGSRRGNVRRVVSFNFDSVLEWYISLCGFVPRVVLQLPVDEGAEDVRIYHPHGFLPHPDFDSEGSDFVILDQKSINQRLGAPHNEWIELLRHVLSSGVGLFVGLSLNSFRDRAIAPMLVEVAHRLENRRPTGLWILKNDEDFNPDDLKEEFSEYNIIPLLLPSYADIPRFLLEICKKAAGRIMVA